MVAFTHLWWSADGPAEDPYAQDAAALHAGRQRVLAIASLIVPGHGAPFAPTPDTPADQTNPGGSDFAPVRRPAWARRQHTTPARGHSDRPGLRSALWLPIFDALADPVVVARLAAEAEEAGWHGVFVWDHLRWRVPVRQVADTWITLAAVAAATERVLLGPMVTPLARRRPAKVAKETATLDRLSGGRLTLGVGQHPDPSAPTPLP